MEISGEKGIKTASGTAAAAVVGIWLAAAVVMGGASAQGHQAAPASSQQEGGTRLSAKLDNVARKGEAPRSVPATTNGRLPFAVYTARVLDVVDGNTLLLQREPNGPRVRITLYGLEAAAPSTVAGRQARTELDKEVTGQTVRVEQRTATSAMIYPLPGGTGAASAARASVAGGGDRPPVVLRPYTGAVNPSGTANDLSATAPTTTAGNSQNALPQDRALALPGGLTVTLNEGLIRKGFARYDFRQAPGEPALSRAQTDAQREGRGIWAATGTARK